VAVPAVVIAIGMAAVKLLCAAWLLVVAELKADLFSSSKVEVSGHHLTSHSDHDYYQHETSLPSP